VALTDPSQLSVKIADLLAQARAIAVVESSRTNYHIGPTLRGLLWRASATPEWYAPGRIPRVYSAVLESRLNPRQEHLLGLAKAMHTWEPEQILFTADGVVRPSEEFRRHGHSMS